ncbi:hypothetical protein CR513_11422, partial [Mucuna pruriens]
MASLAIRIKSVILRVVLLVEDQLIAMIYKINTIGGSEWWWVDTNKTCHVCYGKSFKIYFLVKNQKVLLGNSQTTVVVRIRKVELKFISRKTMVLKAVMHTLEIRKNLFLGYLINKVGFTQTIEGYVIDGMFKLNIKMNKVISSHMICTSNVCYYEFVMLISE